MSAMSAMNPLMRIKTMILLTTDKMEEALTVIFGVKPEGREMMEGDTYSYRCPKCSGRMWGFDSKPEHGLSACPYCNAHVRVRDYKIEDASVD
jgi:DNA-directed RNA polymerase subunit RPC12/RpoP